MHTKIDKEKAMKVVEETASKTVKFTWTIIKIVFISVIIYTVVVTLLLFLQTGVEDFLKNVATISVGGFWAFFLGYFGWRMGQISEEYFTKMRKNK